MIFSPLLLIRALTFVFALSLLPRKVLPLSARFAVVAALLIVSPSEEQKLALSALEILGEITIGLLFALSAGIIGYSLGLLSSWLSGLVQTGISRQESENWRSGYRAESLQILFSLLLLYLFFSSNACVEMFSYFGASLTISPVGGSLSEATTAQTLAPALLSWTIKIGKTALELAIVLALPFIVASLFVDIASVTLSTFIERVVDDTSSSAIKLVSFVFLLSTVLYPFSNRITEELERSFASKQIRQVSRVYLFGENGGAGPEAAK